MHKIRWVRRLKHHNLKLKHLNFNSLVQPVKSNHLLRFTITPLHFLLFDPNLQFKLFKLLIWLNQCQPYSSYYSTSNFNSNIFICSKGLTNAYFSIEPYRTSFLKILFPNIGLYHPRRYYHPLFSPLLRYHLHLRYQVVNHSLNFIPSCYHSTLHFRVTYKLLIVLIFDADLKI